MANTEMTRSYSMRGESVHVHFQPYRVALATEFGTSHSHSSERTNALITISISATGDNQKWTGYGEAGLPPKKKGIYMANYQDVSQYVYKWMDDLSDVLKDNTKLESAEQYDPFSSLQPHLFPSTRDSSDRTASDTTSRILRCLLYVLDHTTRSYEDESKYPSQMCVESALLGLWAHTKNVPLWQFIGLKNEKRHAFYTVGLNPDISKMVESSDTGLAHTPYLKIKVDADIDKMERIFAALMDHRKQSNIKETAGMVAIDANCAWTPEIAMKAIPALTALGSALFMVEQPFPAHAHHGDPQGEEMKQWKEVKKAYAAHGLRIVADEAVCTVADVDRLVDIADGVNVKLEKAGGIRPALAALSKAKELGMLIWVGVMVGSSLNSSTAAQLFPLTTFGGDPDGSLLVTEDSSLFAGGFGWGTGDLYGTMVMNEKPAQGCTRK